MIKLLLIILVFSLTTDSLSKTTLAILELKDKGAGNSTASILTDNLLSEFSKITDYEIVERDQLETILKEQGLQNSGLCDNNECLVEIGGLLGAQKMVTGSIGKLGKSYSLSVRIFDIQSAKSENSVTLNKKCEPEDLPDLIKQAVNDLSLGLERRSAPDNNSVVNIDFKEKNREFKEYQQSVESFQNKMIENNIKSTTDNIAATIASSTAAYYAQFYSREVLDKLASTKTDFGEKISPSTINMSVPNDYKVEINKFEVKVIHKNGYTAIVKWNVE